MYARLSDNYRLVGRSLYKKQGNAFIHAAIVPPHCKWLYQAIAWFESEE